MVSATPVESTEEFQRGLDLSRMTPRSHNNSGSQTEPKTGGRRFDVMPLGPAAAPPSASEVLQETVFVYLEFNRGLVVRHVAGKVPARLFETRPHRIQHGSGSAAHKLQISAVFPSACDCQSCTHGRNQDGPFRPQCYGETRVASSASCAPPNKGRPSAMIFNLRPPLATGTARPKSPNSTLVATLAREGGEHGATRST